MIARMILPRSFQILFACTLVIAGLGCTKQGDSKETLLSRANDYYVAEQYEKAEQEYRNVLRLAPTEVVAIHRLAVIYFEQGQLQQAYSMLKQAAEREPDDLEIQLKLALTYLSVREFQQARDIAQQIL